MISRTPWLPIALLLLCGCQSVQAQKFEVASIKPQPWTNEGGVGVYIRGNTLTGEHADLYTLVEFAYGLTAGHSQLSGGPPWAHRGILSDVSGGESVLYHIVAKAAEGPLPSSEQFPLMPQVLLAERFQLKIHHATTHLKVFNLVFAHGGRKFKESLPDAKPSLAMRDGFRMRAVHARISQLVDELADPNHGAGRPVFDNTGLTGFYDFEIQWTPSFTTGPSVFMALQEQLGLKLEPGIAPFDTVVIDHAEKPSQN